MKPTTHFRVIGENIKLYRIKAGLTHHDMSQRLEKQGISIKPSAIKAYEKGKGAISACTLHHIAKLLNADITQFHEKARPEILLDDQTLHLIQAYRMIRRESHRELMLHLARGLAQR